MSEILKKEIIHLNNLPLGLKNAPILIKTAMGRNGNFEIAWAMDKKVLFIWALSDTWNYILRDLVKQDNTTKNYYINLSQKQKFLDKIQQPSNYGFLGDYPSSLYKKLIRSVKPWHNQAISDNIGKWVELAYLLPSYINCRFGEQLHLAGHRDKNKLKIILKYAEKAHEFLDDRGSLIGCGVGESGLWLDGNPSLLPNRDFRLIWGLGGRSDFAIQKRDGSVEYWDLKTRSFNNSVSSANELIKTSDLEQIKRQAPMKLIYSGQSYQPFPIIHPVETIGILAIGCDINGDVIHKYEIVSDPREGIKPLDHSITTTRTAQLFESLNTPEQRVNLAADILKEAVEKLVTALESSNEWEAIEKALGSHHKRKWGNLRSGTTYKKGK